MKVRIEIDQTLAATELVIRSPKEAARLKVLQSKLADFKYLDTMITFYQADKAYYFEVDKILFFETDGRQIYAHTESEAFLVHERLYELETILATSFARISKSTIVNLTKIYVLKHTVTTTTITFQATYKAVYVSRRYYKQLKQRISEVNINA